MKRIVQIYQRAAVPILAIAVVLTGVCIWISTGLELDANLERLLPDDAPSVQGLRTLESDYGIVGRVSVVLEGSDPEQLKSEVERLSNLTTAIDGVHWTEFKRPNAFFEKNRLVYLETDDLETVQTRFNARLKWEKQQANPLFVDVSGKSAPSLDFSDIEKKYETFDVREYYCNDAESQCAFFVFPKFSAGDLNRTRKIVEDVRAIVATNVDPSVEWGLSGRYTKRIEQQDALTEDLRRGTIVALIGLLLFLAFYFRGIVTPTIVTIPLIMGTTWAFAYARIIFESLNILTGFFGAVLLGLGIDYGIHLVSRYNEARETEETADALITTLNSTGRASIYAGLTTVVAFGSLMFSSFRAFFEYGAIALGGMGLIIVAYLVVLPCLLIVINGTKFDVKPMFNISVKNWRPSWKVTATAAALGVGIGLFGLPNVGFESDFSKIQSTDIPSWKLDESVDKILGISQVPSVFLTKDRSSANVVAETIRKRKVESKSGWTIDRVMTIDDLVPSDQKRKFEILESMKNEIEKLPARVLKGEFQRGAAEITQLAEKGPLSISDLPTQVSVPLSQRADPNGGVVLAFPTIEQHDAKEMIALAEVIRNVELPDGSSVDGISDALLLVDILQSVERDAAVMVSVTLIGMFLIAVFAFRDPKKIAVLFLTITCAAVAGLGWVGLFGVKFNFINMLVVPIWLGLGVDAAFHLMVRQEESPDDFDGFISTAVAVSAAFLTSVIGFGSMLITSHSGLFSMGAIACIGLLAILIISTLVQATIFLRSSSQ